MSDYELKSSLAPVYSKRK